MFSDSSLLEASSLSSLPCNSFSRLSPSVFFAWRNSWSFDSNSSWWSFFKPSISSWCFNSRSLILLSDECSDSITLEMAVSFSTACALSCFLKPAILLSAFFFISVNLFLYCSVSSSACCVNCCSLASSISLSFSCCSFSCAFSLDSKLCVFFPISASSVCTRCRHSASFVATASWASCFSRLSSANFSSIALLLLSPVTIFSCNSSWRFSVSLSLFSQLSSFSAISLFKEDTVSCSVLTSWSVFSWLSRISFNSCSCFAFILLIFSFAFLIFNCSSDAVFCASLNWFFALSSDSRRSSLFLFVNSSIAFACSSVKVFLSSSCCFSRFCIWVE